MLFVIPISISSVSSTSAWSLQPRLPPILTSPTSSLTLVTTRSSISSPRVGVLTTFIPLYSIKQIPEEAKVCSPEVQGSGLAAHLPHCPKDLKVHYFVVTAAKAALDFHIPHQSLLVGKNKVQYRTSPRGLLYHLEEEVVINTFQEPPGLPVPCILFLALF